MKFLVTEPHLKEDKSDQRNVFRLVNQLRAMESFTLRTTGATATDGAGTFKAIWVETVDLGATAFIVARVVGRGATGSAWYDLKFGAQNIAGTLTTNGAGVSLDFEEDNAACDIRVVYTGTTVSVEVRDDGAEVYNWTGYFEAVLTNAP